jgi:periplasmic divalent cation tolerance protein
MAQEFIQLVTTTETETEAQRIARSLVEKRLAACVHVVGPITSTYRWKGSVETAREWLCLAKTSRGMLDRVMKTVRELHSYEVPELVALPIIGGSPDYLEWLGGELIAP